MVLQAGHDRLTGVQQQLQEALERLAITRLAPRPVMMYYNAGRHVAATPHA